MRILDPNFRSRFQISAETGISQDYFNDILIRDPDVILNPERYYKRSGGEPQLRRELIDQLRELKTYTQYIEGVVERHNSPKKDSDGNLHQSQEQLCLDDLISNENIEIVRELDGIVTSMKELGVSPEKLDLRLLMDLMYRGTLLIYGGSYEERLKIRFGVKK